MRVEELAPESVRFRTRQLLSGVRRALRPNASVPAAAARLTQEAPAAAGEVSPIFVLGGGWRTGSTFVQRALNASPGLLVWGEPFGEGALVQRLAESISFLDPRHGRFAGRTLPDGDAPPSPDAWTANLTPPLAHLVASYRQLMDQLFAVPAREHGCARWGIKEVVWGRDEIHFLRMLYPDARILLLVREPLAQWRSYRPKTRNPWFYRWPETPIGSPFTFGRLWARLARDFAQASRELPGVLLVRYEDLKTPIVLKELAEFLNIEAPSLMQGDEARVGSSAPRPYFRSRVPAWESHVIRRLTRKSAQLVGYHH